MIAVIDYGMGNLRSVQKALEKLGGDVEVISDAERLSLSDKVVLPGVGAFKDTMGGIEKRGLTKPILEFIDSGKPYLGICMGLQVLFSESEEGGRFKGLGVFKGCVRRFNPGGDLKVPHMGWNQLGFRGRCRLFDGIEDDSYFYFDHSYYVAPEDESIIAAVTDYGTDFASVVCADNIYAVQFHPEKSQKIGLKMLRNFVDL